jgi:NADH dehydrogenase
VIGGGPTGVELAGAIAELATFVLARDFRSIRPDSTRVVLVEGSERPLAAFGPELSAHAARSLAEMGVEVLAKTRVTGIDADGVNCGDLRIDASTVLWAAGVRASPLVATLGVPLDRQGRVVVEQDCSVPGHPEAFVIGDAALFVPKGEQQPLPGVSPVAIQQGRFVARHIARVVNGEPAPDAFRYFDKGVMATIGRSRAVARIGRLRLSGFVAWFAWLLLHIFYLMNFRNRLLVFIDWAWSYFTYQRGSRLITGHRLEPGTPTSVRTAKPDGNLPVSGAGLN